MKTILCESQHPIAATIKQINTLDQFLIGDIGELETGWFLASELVSNPHILEEGLGRLKTKYPDADSQTVGAHFIGEYSWYITGIAIGTYLAARRVPDLSPENIALRYTTFQWTEHGESGEGERFDVRFLSHHFGALIDDPASQSSDALMFSDVAALREWMRTTLEAHLMPLVDQLYVITHLGRAAQWTLIADACAALFLHAGTLLNSSLNWQKEGLAFVKVPGSPLCNKQTGYFTLEYGGHCETFRARGGCCRYYTLPNADKCSTCVLRSLEDRNERLLAHMAEKYTLENIS